MMGWLRRTLHLDEPVVTDDDRAELAHLRSVTADASADARNQAAEATRLHGFFKEQYERNHIAERLNIAIQRGK